MSKINSKSPFILITVVFISNYNAFEINFANGKKRNKITFEIGLRNVN